MLRVRGIVFAILLVLGIKAFASECLYGMPGAIVCLSSAKARFSLLCEQDKPGHPTFCVLDHDKNAPMSEARFKLVSCDSAAEEPDVIGALVKSNAVFSGGVCLSYRLKALRRVDVRRLHLRVEVPVSDYAGGSVALDGRAVTIDSSYANVFRLATGTVSRVAFTDAAGIGRFSIQPVGSCLVDLVDARGWGGDNIELRFEIVERRQIREGELLGLDLILEAPGGVKLQGEPRVVEAGADWIPFRFDREILQGSACDFSLLTGIDSPAGRHGWLVARGENFVFEDQPDRAQRFFGINLGWWIPLTTTERASKLARELTRTGYNAVRLHFWDICLTDGVEDGTTIPEERMVAFDGFMKEMIDAGIYVSTDLYSSRRVPYREIGIDRDGCCEMDEYKELLLCYEPAVSNLEKFVRQLLTHKNVHTGRDYAHEPALAWYCLVNEGDAGNSGLRYIRKHPYMRVLWEKWIDERAADPVFQAVSRDIPSDFQEKSLQGAVWRQFLRCLEARFDRRMKGFVRALGSRALVSSMNAWFNPPSYQLVREDVYDFVDDHFYVDHPRFAEGGGLPSTCAGLNPVRDGRAGVPNVICRRLLDKPFTVSEYNHSVPGRFRGAGGVLVASFAALQNWSAVWRFTFGAQCERIDDSNFGLLRYHDTWSDPIMRATEYPFAALFLRKDMLSESKAIQILMPRGKLERPHVEPVTSMGHLPWAPWAWMGKTGAVISDEQVANCPMTVHYPNALTLTRKEFGDRFFPEGKSGSQLPMIANGALKIDESGGSYVLATERTCAVFAEQGRMEAGQLAVEIIKTPSVVWAVSLDNEPIRRSNRILVGHLTDALQAGTTFATDDVTCLQKWGREGETLVRAGEAKVALFVEPGDFEVWALSSGGRRRERVPIRTHVNGWICFSADVARDVEAATYLYEVVRRRDCEGM